MKILKKMKKGFTLVELVVVIAVIAILSAVSVVTYIGVTDNARARACDSEGAQLKTLIMTEDIANDSILVEGNKITFYGEYDLEDLLGDMGQDAQNYTTANVKVVDKVVNDVVVGKALEYSREGKTYKVFDEVVFLTTQTSETGD